MELRRLLGGALLIVLGFGIVPATSGASVALSRLGGTFDNPYRLVLVSRDGAGNRSAAKRAKFRIVGRSVVR